MGTKAKCTKCGDEKWINTSKLKRLHETFGIKPKDWLNKYYVCKECAYRINQIRQSDTKNIIDNLNTFVADCKSIYYGAIKESDNENINDVIQRKLKRHLFEKGLISFPINYTYYKKTIIGFSIEIPIIGELSIILI